MLSTTFQIKKILLIDDDEDDCLVFKMALAEIDPSITLFYECYGDAVEKTLSATEPDIIFLDINLPRVNGIECLEQIQQSALYHTVPVVMYSSSEQARDLSSAYQAGAILYFRKPSNISSLIQSLKKILSMNWQDTSTIRSQYGNGKKFETV